MISVKGNFSNDQQLVFDMTAAFIPHLVGSYH